MQGCYAAKALDSVSLCKGMFRTFLLPCLKNTSAYELTERPQPKRGGGSAVESLDPTELMRKATLCSIRTYA